MLSVEHLATGCYEHNTSFLGVTMVILRSFWRGDLVMQDGAGGL